MLQDMSTELQKGLDDDKAVHELLFCWCKTNDQEKTAAIQMGKAKLEQLQSTMDEATAKLIESKAKRKSTQEEQYADEKTLDQAEEMRMKENKAFHAEETDLMEAVEACDQATTVLGQHHAGLAQVRAAAQRMSRARVPDLVLRSSGLQREQVEVLKKFLGKADSASSFLSVPGFSGYTPQSGQIFGILKQMTKDFKDSLSDTQAAEMKAQKEFEDLKAAKEDEIATAKKLILELDATIANLNTKHAEAAQEYEDTETQLGLDQQFLATLKTKCAETEDEFAARVKSRTEEIQAVDETIEILNSDEAFDNFDKTVKVSFLQNSIAESQEARSRRAKAATLLQQAAARTGASTLVVLAASAELDAFTKVKEEIDKLVTELSTQQGDEVKHRDWCIAEFNDNKRETEKGYDKKSSLEVKIAELKKTIASLTEDIATTTKAVAEMQKQMKAASETREAENADFQQTVNDQRLTQQILTKALARMKEVYAGLLQQPGAAHIATSGTHTDPGNAPARFTKYEQNAGGKRVVVALEEVIADSKKMEDEAIRDEEDAQEAYESTMKAQNKSIQGYLKSITNLSAALARSKEMLLAAEQDFKQTMTELEGLNSYLKDLHRSCDFIMENFDARQEARAAEIQALREAKNILSGMQ